MELPQMPHPDTFPSWWRAQQRRIANLSSNSLVTTAAHSDHRSAGRPDCRSSAQHAPERPRMSAIMRA